MNEREKTWKHKDLNEYHIWTILALIYWIWNNLFWKNTLTTFLKFITIQSRLVKWQVYSKMEPKTNSRKPKAPFVSEEIFMKFQINKQTDYLNPPHTGRMSCPGDLSQHSILLASIPGSICALQVELTATAWCKTDQRKPQTNVYYTHST